MDIQKMDMNVQTEVEIVTPPLQNYVHLSSPVEGEQQEMSRSYSPSEKV